MQALASRGVVRRLRSSERGLLRDHLLRLDDDARRLRFGGYASAERIESYCALIEWRHALIVGYLVEGQARGIGELMPLEGRPRSAEIAVSVERPWQGRGVGSALLRRLIVAARNRLFERLYMVCLIDNGPMVRMARRLEGRLSIGHGEVEAWIEPLWPTAWTLLEEAWAEAGAPDAR